MNGDSINRETLRGSGEKKNDRKSLKEWEQGKVQEKNVKNCEFYGEKNSCALFFPNGDMSLMITPIRPLNCHQVYLLVVGFIYVSWLCNRMRLHSRIAPVGQHAGLIKEAQHSTYIRCSFLCSVSCALTLALLSVAVAWSFLLSKKLESQGN